MRTSKPGIKSKPRTPARAKAELKLVKPAKPVTQKVADWFGRIFALVLLKVRGRG